MTKEEAIEIYNGLINPKIKEAFEFFVPELTESDDEKIRKAIILALRGNGQATAVLKNNGVYWEDAIIWLKKQKEYKSLPIDLSVEDVETIKAALKVSGLEFTLNQKVYDKLEKLPKSTYYLSTVGHSELYPDGRIERHIIGYLEKQKEQKTLTSNDLDEEIHRFFDECIETHDAKIYGVNERVITVDCYELIAHHFAKWAEKQKEPHYSPLCKTIKDKIREYIANHFVADTVVKTDMKSIVKAMEEGVRLGKEEQKPLSTEETELNSIAFLEQMGYTCIPPTKELKPAEWSEEDENRFNNLCSVIDESESWNDVSKQAFKDWLKSLRPQPNWKPSEEQMKYLVAAIEESNENPVLESLYNDLKKL